MVWMPGLTTILRDQIVITGAVILGLGFRVVMSTLQKARDRQALARERGEVEQQEAAAAAERHVLLREIEDLRTENQGLRAELSNTLQGAGQF
ncbi:unnamed protein product [Linum trigynum]|uniref:Uncharacterized protein n=1 Tax=Linum trigynum TaxID=586398 RepID=A0AAV2F7Q9_9ROSI